MKYLKKNAATWSERCNLLPYSILNFLASTSKQIIRRI